MEFRHECAVSGNREKKTGAVKQKSIHHPSCLHKRQKGTKIILQIEADELMTEACWMLCGLHVCDSPGTLLFWVHQNKCFLGMFLDVKTQCDCAENKLSRGAGCILYPKGLILHV